MLTTRECNFPTENGFYKSDVAVISSGYIKNRLRIDESLMHDNDGIVHRVSCERVKSDREDKIKRMFQNANS